MKDYKLAKYYLILFYGITGILFYLLSAYTPLMADDFPYAYVFNEEGTNILSPITTVKDIIISQYHHYFIANGRSVVHFGEQFFVGILGRSYFNVFNTLIFLLLLYGGSYLISNKRKLTASFILFLLVWFFIPVPGETLLWTAGSFNYLWSTTLVVLFLCLIKRPSSWLNKFWLFPFLFLIGVFCGWTHEGLSAGVSGALFIYYCLDYKKFTGKIIPLVVGFWLGTVLVLFAPSIWDRAQGALEESNLISILAVRVRFLMYTKLFPFLIVVMIYLFFRKRLRLKKLLKENTLLCWIILFEFLFGCMIGLQSIRQVFFIELFSAILLGRIFCDYLDVKSVLLKKILYPALVLLFITDYSSVLRACNINYKLYQEIFNASMRSKEDVIASSYKRQATFFTTHDSNRFVHAYFFTHNPAYYLNSMLAFYVHKSHLVILPEDIYVNLYQADHFCNESNFVLENIYTKPDIDFYVMPIAPDSIDYEKDDVFYAFDAIQLDELPWYMKMLRPFVKRLNPPESMTVSSAVTRLKTLHGDYLLIDKPYFMDMGVKVKDIRLVQQE
ncbi:hypothetical protein H8784_03840 [Parabacteroides acidifaciens]|uniref:Glycosyltransferase RgtA/B/C/D-like domain-containing protein n=1 Tax=Parabacteroides acidifaciens TaxID=2290935 RepID=A0A3D8HI13_9BACT|nr:DUF6056 family protein [Parabacteroides acidifaciens]MBC8600849.1 hypothetical protein [Parabacteroides acidifaciens]RDU50571.1 hypothetical protein DWU89_03890 [Parabacteroides acidifaciens]